MRKNVSSVLMGFTNARNKLYIVGSKNVLTVSGTPGTTAHRPNGKLSFFKIIKEMDLNYFMFSDA